MKNKINVRFMSVAALAIIATVIFTTVIYYHLFQKEVMDELAGYANVMGASKDFSEDLSTFQTGNKNLRITLVAPDGTVLYDNYEPAEKLDNHKDGPGSVGRGRGRRDQKVNDDQPIQFLLRRTVKQWKCAACGKGIKEYFQRVPQCVSGDHADCTGSVLLLYVAQSLSDPKPDQSDRTGRRQLRPFGTCYDLQGTDAFCQCDPYPA